MAVNIEIEKDAKGRIHFIVDPKKEFGPSGSGKTTRVASSEGNQTVDGLPNNFKYGLNVYKK